MHGLIFERSATELGTQPAGMMMMMMPGSASACDAPQPKRKRVQAPASAMKRRLAEHGDPRWTQEQCDSMTKKQLLTAKIYSCRSWPTHLWHIGGYYTAEK